jgi:hypothetical protein
LYDAGLCRHVRVLHINITGSAACRNLHEFEDTKGVIRICKSKDRQHNDQMKKDKQRSTNHTQKTKDPY